MNCDKDLIGFVLRSLRKSIPALSACSSDTLEIFSDFAFFTRQSLLGLLWLQNFCTFSNILIFGGKILGEFSNLNKLLVLKVLNQKSSNKIMERLPKISGKNSTMKFPKITQIYSKVITPQFFYE